MRFFHLSDLHIGLKLMNHDLGEDQEFILNEIAQKAAEADPDAVVIAGDIYDKAVPSAEAVALFDRFISALTAAVPGAEIMMISGNHDSAPRINVFRSVLGRQKIHMIGMPPEKAGDHIEKVTLQDEYGNVNFYLLPFVKPSMVREITGQDEKGNNLSYDEAVHRLIARENIDQTERNVLVSHQFYLPTGKDPDEAERTDAEIRTVGNIDVIWADALRPFDYAALGHIHKPMKVGNDCYRYSGTPIAMSFSEAGQPKGINLVEMKEKGNVSVRVLPLTPLHEVRLVSGTLPEVLKKGTEDYVSVTLTDKVDLDVFDMQDRLRRAFPNLLEIRRENLRGTDYKIRRSGEKEMDAFELCCLFLNNDLDTKEKELLRDVINQVKEA